MTTKCLELTVMKNCNYHSNIKGFDSWMGGRAPTARLDPQFWECSGIVCCNLTVCQGDSIELEVL